MKCPICGNTKFDRLDFALIQCTECMSLFDPFVHPDFSEPTVDVGQIWDTTSSDRTNQVHPWKTVEEDNETEEVEFEDEDWDMEDDDFENDFDDDFDEEIDDFGDNEYQDLIGSWLESDDEAWDTYYDDLDPYIEQ